MVSAIDPGLAFEASRPPGRRSYGLPVGPLHPRSIEQRRNGLFRKPRADRGNPGTSLTADASRIPFYSVYSVVGQANYILPTKNLVGFFKYYDEYLAYSHFQGTTIVFGLSWTVLEPKPPAHHP